MSTTTRAAPTAICQETTVGNSAPRVVAGIVNQAEAFTHTCFMIAPYEGFVGVCEALNRLTPGDHERHSALFNSGAEAVENAVKIARVYTGRQALRWRRRSRGLDGLDQRTRHADAILAVLLRCP